MSISYWVKGHHVHECAHKQEEDAIAQALSGTMCVGDEQEFVRKAQITGGEGTFFHFKVGLERSNYICRQKKLFRKKTLWNFGTLEGVSEMRSSVHNAVADI
jgi:hypothetical protein